MSRTSELFTPASDNDTMPITDLDFANAMHDSVQADNDKLLNKVNILQYVKDYYTKELHMFTHNLEVQTKRSANLARENAKLSQQVDEYKSMIQDNLYLIYHGKVDTYMAKLIRENDELRKENEDLREQVELQAQYEPMVNDRLFEIYHGAPATVSMHLFNEEVTTRKAFSHSLKQMYTKYMKTKNKLKDAMKANRDLIRVQQAKESMTNHSSSGK